MSTVTFMHRPKDVEELHRQLSVEVMTAKLSKVGTVTSADGRFQVLEVLDHGASSVVCDVLDTKLNRRVALKLFPGLADDRLARGVKGEAQRIAAISHPNIVPSLRRSARKPQEPSRVSSSVYFPIFPR